MSRPTELGTWKKHFIFLLSEAFPNNLTKYGPDQAKFWWPMLWWGGCSKFKSNKRTRVSLLKSISLKNIYIDFNSLFQICTLSSKYLRHSSFWSKIPMTQGRMAMNTSSGCLLLDWWWRDAFLWKKVDETMTEMTSNYLVSCDFIKNVGRLSSERKKTPSWNSYWVHSGKQIDRNLRETLNIRSMIYTKRN